MRSLAPLRLLVSGGLRRVGRLLLFGLGWGLLAAQHQFEVCAEAKHRLERGQLQLLGDLEFGQNRVEEHPKRREVENLQHEELRAVGSRPVALALKYQKHKVSEQIDQIAGQC